MPLRMAPATGPSSSPAARASSMQITPRVLTVPKEVPSSRLMPLHSTNAQSRKYDGSTSGRAR